MPENIKSTVVIPKVSIGMPVYNGERYIRPAIESLLAQTFTDFELIISDNCSTDNTKAICLEYMAKDSRIKYKQQQQNNGALSNFMFVLHESSGEYFMWAAADDYWSHNWLELLIADLKENINIAFGHVVGISEAGLITDRYGYRRFSQNKFIRSIQLFLSEEYHYKANFIYGLYRRTEVLKYQFHNTFGGDNIFVYEVVQNGGLSTNPNILLFKRFVSNSEANSAPQAYSSRTRKWLLLDYFPYYRVYFQLPVSNFLKAILFMLLPVKHLKSLLFIYCRYIIVKFKLQAYLGWLMQL